MRRRRDRLVLGVLAASVLVTALGPFVVAVVRIIRDPPPEHADLIVLGAAGEAINRLILSLGVAAVVLVLRVVIAASHPHKTREQRWTTLSDFWRRRSGEEQDCGITSGRNTERT